MKKLEDFLDYYTSYEYDEIEDIFETQLDELYEPVEIAGMTIYASHMKQLDPIMFNCGLSDFSSEYYTEHCDGSYYLNDDYEKASADYDDYLNDLEDYEEGETYQITEEMEKKEDEYKNKE